MTYKPSGSNGLRGLRGFCGLSGFSGLGGLEIPSGLKGFCFGLDIATSPY
jgi:hypothetical protein